MPSKTTAAKATPLVNGQIKRGRTPSPRKAPAAKAARKPPQSVASRVATLETQVAELRIHLDTLMEKHVALATMIQKAAVKQIMDNPQMREKLEAALMSKMPAI
jgi:hypothetical protein